MVKTVNQNQTNTKNLFLAAIITMATILSVGMFTIINNAKAQDQPSFTHKTDKIVIRPADPIPYKLGEWDVAQEFVGASCNVVAKGENNSSVHQGNDVRVFSGNSNVWLRDVEATAGKITQGDKDIVLGNKLTAELAERGPSGWFSATLEISFTCQDPEPVRVCNLGSGQIETVSPEQAKDTTKYGPADSEACVTVKRCDLTTGRVVEISAREAQDTNRYANTDSPLCQENYEEEPDATLVCENLEIQNLEGRTIRAVVTYTDSEGLPFSGVEFDFGDGSEVLPSSSPITEYTYEEDGEYRLTARLTGSDETNADGVCAQTVAFEGGAGADIEPLEDPEDLPATGTVGIVAGSLATALAGYGGYRYVSLRKSKH
jgi:hypothetical protein